MHRMSFWPRSVAPPLANHPDEDDVRAAEARDCIIAMAAYLPPGGGVAPGACLVELLELMDGGDMPATGGDTAARIGAAEVEPPSQAANPGATRH